MAEDEVVGRHHQLNGHELKQALGNGSGAGSLVCCRPRGRKEPDRTLSNNRKGGALEPRCCFGSRPSQLSLLHLERVFGLASISPQCILSGLLLQPVCVSLERPKHTSSQRQLMLPAGRACPQAVTPRTLDRRPDPTA